jgi:hypothetical protein
VQLELARRAYMNEQLEQMWEAQHAQRAQVLIEKLLRKYLTNK